MVEITPLDGDLWGGEDTVPPLQGKWVIGKIVFLIDNFISILEGKGGLKKLNYKSN